MTAFAELEKEWQGQHYKFQAKCVNHRFFDLKLRAGRDWQILENEIKSWLKAPLIRGSLDLWIDYSSNSIAPEQDSTKNKVSTFLKQFKSALEYGEDVKMSNPIVGTAIKAFALLNNSHLWMSELDNSANASPKEIIGVDNLKKWIEELAEKLHEERLREGAQTHLAILEIHDSLLRSLNLLNSKIPALLEEWRKNMEERIAKLAEKLEQASPDSSRIYQEFVMLADKKDVSEELQRIDSHLKALKKMLDAPSEMQIGKKLDFLAQELNREFTTLNNKTQDPETSEFIGLAKLQVEKIREQSLNLV